MDWINIHRTTLSTEEFLGCDPVQRATWLCLLAYCVDQENGGTICEAGAWGDRRWQQIIRITKAEAQDKCPLWSWDGLDLTVWAYPLEKEAIVQQRRGSGRLGGSAKTQAKTQASKQNGALGGRPISVSRDSMPTPEQNNPSRNPSRNPSETQAETQRNRNRKGKELEEPPIVPQSEKISRSYPTESEVVEHCAKHFPTWHHSSVRDLYRHYVSTDWNDREGKKIKNWKNKFSMIHKFKSEKGTTGPTKEWSDSQQSQQSADYFNERLALLKEAEELNGR